MVDISNSDPLDVHPLHLYRLRRHEPAPSHTPFLSCPPWDLLQASHGRTPWLECSEDEEEKERNAAAAAKLSERERIRTSREALPSFAYRQQFLDAVYQHQVLIIVAETGAGKTTQLPQYLLEEGFGKAGAVPHLSRMHCPWKSRKFAVPSGTRGPGAVLCCNSH